MGSEEFVDWVYERYRPEFGPGPKVGAKEVPEPWAAAEAKVEPRCRASACQIRSLVEHLRAAPDFRRKESLAYPLAGMLALIAMGTFCGAVRGQRDLAAVARSLSGAQLRALGFRRSLHTGRVRCPDETTFFRALRGVDAMLLERALLA